MPCKLMVVENLIRFVLTFCRIFAAKRFSPELLYLILFIISALAVNSNGQSRATTSHLSEQSFRRAKLTIENGLKALGGRTALKSLRILSLKETGTQHHVHQSVSPYPPFSTATIEESVVIDLEHNRYFRELKNTFPGNWAWLKTIITGNEGHTLDLLTRTIRPIPNAAVANQRGQFRKFPHLVLLEALERATTLRWLGEAVYKGRKQSVVTFVRADNQQTALYFDAQTNLLTKFEFLYTDNFAGDSVQEQIFSSYRSLGNFKIPSSRTVTVAGHIWVETRYVDVSFDAPVDKSIFEMPADFLRLPAYPPLSTSVFKLADDVYFLQGSSHNSMFVVFNDYVLAVDAPEPSPSTIATSEGFLRRIKEIAPDKPIRYLVPTHHHTDHAGGVRAYVAEGATIVTTQGNRRYFEELVTKPFTFVEDALQRNPRKPIFEIIENKKRVFRDDKHTVEIYDIGPSPHANEMLVVYLPKEKILFQSDLFAAPDEQTIPFAFDATVHLVAAIKRLGLDVERIAGGHGIVTTIEKLRQSIKELTAYQFCSEIERNPSLLL